MAQVFSGVKTRHLMVVPMKSESDMADAFQDCIREHGAPIALFSDNAKAEIGKEVTKALRTYAIRQHRSEPYYQNQNPCERSIQDIKRMVNELMDRFGIPAQFWLLVLLYVVYLLNRLSRKSLNDLTPEEKLTGYRPDISPLLHFRLWQPVYYRVHGSGTKFPSGTQERLGRWMGVTENIGDTMTYWILAETGQLLPRSDIRSALDEVNPNYRASSGSQSLDTILEEYVAVDDELDIPLPDGGEVLDADDDDDDDLFPKVAPIPLNEKGEPKECVRTFRDVLAETIGDMDPSDIAVPEFSPSDLQGMTYLKEVGDQTFRARVVKKIEDADAQNHQNLKFLVEYGGGVEEILTYVELCDIIDEQNDAELDELAENDGERKWTYTEIRDHKDVKPDDDMYMGSSINVKILWEDGSTTWEPLTTIAKDDPITCTQYASKMGLLDKPGWKRFKRFAKREKKYIRMINQSQQRRKNSGPVYKFGVQIPRNSKEARILDERNGNTLWQDAEKVERDQLAEYNTLDNRGRKAKIPQGYHMIRCHMVYDCKHDLRRKARLVAGGHLTPEGDDSYSGVCRLRTMRMALTGGILNGLRVMVGDVGNAYLEAFTKEKVCFIAGPEFGELEGCLMIIVKALYGLRTSGKRYHEKFADILRDEGWEPCKGDPDCWMKMSADGSCWMYLCIYVDDLMAIMDDPEAFFTALVEVYKLKLKGVGPPKYHLGGDFFYDADGTLAWGATTYINRLVDNCKIMFDGEEIRPYSSPLEKGDSPELDTTAELDAEGIKKYMSLMGALQWCVTLGRFDIACAVMTLGRFRMAPREGHMLRAKRVVGYLKGNKDGAIRFRTGIPDHEAAGFSQPECDWMYSVYGDEGEEVPDDIPQPLGKKIRITHFVDANLMHCKVTGKSCDGYLTFINQTLVDHDSKRQATVETATFGSEFVAARKCTEAAIDIRLMARYMGMPLDGPSWMFGDNQSVITQSTLPQSVLTKRHNALAYHRVRSAVAARVIYFCKIEGTQNPADVLTKFLPYAVFYPLVMPILFRKG
jgi:hypothetical protein